ncbi:uncharacterized protein LOC110090902 [Pogona vitticeps]
MLGSLPVVSDGYTNINLYINVEVPGQGILSIPDLAGSINVPPLGNFKHVHAFHPALINILLFIFAPKDSFELPCTPDKFSGADDLRNAILLVVPLENQAIVSAGVLNIRISTEMYPEAVFGPNGIVITVTAKIEFFIRNADGSTYSVLVVRSRVALGAVLSFVNGRVIFVVSITGNALELIYSDARISDVSSLESHCGKLLGETVLPVFNSNLAFGFPIPSIFGADLINPTFFFIEGVLLVGF